MTSRIDVVEWIFQKRRRKEPLKEGWSFKTRSLLSCVYFLNACRFQSPFFKHVQPIVNMNTSIYIERWKEEDKSELTGKYVVWMRRGGESNEGSSVVSLSRETDLKPLWLMAQNSFWKLRRRAKTFPNLKMCLFSLLLSIDFCHTIFNLLSPLCG